MAALALGLIPNMSLHRDIYLDVKIFDDEQGATADQNANAQLYKITSAQIAGDGKVEQGAVAAVFFLAARPIAANQRVDASEGGLPPPKPLSEGSNGIMQSAPAFIQNERVDPSGKTVSDKARQSFPSNLVCRPWR